VEIGKNEVGDVLTLKDGTKALVSFTLSDMKFFGTRSVYVPSAGEQVQYWSVSKGKFFPAVIERLNSDGTVDLDIRKGKPLSRCKCNLEKKPRTVSYVPFSLVTKATRQLYWQIQEGRYPPLVMIKNEDVEPQSQKTIKAYLCHVLGRTFEKQEATDLKRNEEVAAESKENVEAVTTEHKAEAMDGDFKDEKDG